MCDPTDIQNPPLPDVSAHTAARKLSRPSWIQITGGSFLLLLLSAPLFISEVIGGWTTEYTSPLRFGASSIGDMTGKVVIVTGANTGIGYETSLELARNGATVIMAARSVERGTAAVERVRDEVTKGSKSDMEPDLRFLRLDLASLASVQKFASEFWALKLPLHVLILNAGVMKSPGSKFVGRDLTYGFETTSDGFEYHIGVNHIAHVYLTSLLTDDLKKSAPSRIVSVSSLAEKSAYKEGFLFEDWVPKGGAMPERYEDGRAYGQSKLSNLMFASEFASRMNGTGVTAYALHPGVIVTEGGRYLDPVIKGQLKEEGILSYCIGMFFGQVFQSARFDARGGALTQLHLATAPVENLVNGGNYHPVGRLAVPAHPQGTNVTLKGMLWEETERAIAMKGRYRYRK